MDENRPTSADALALRRRGRLQEAVEAYSKLYEFDGRPPSLSGRGRTYLLMGNYAAALADFEQAIAIEAPNFLGDSQFLSLGVAHWFLNQPTHSIAAWQRGLNTPYTDAAGGVELPALLLYGAVRLRDALLEKKAIKLLEQFATDEKKAWPGSIAPFLLGKIDTQELLSNIKASKSDILRARFQCQADFFIGLRAYIKSDKRTFQEAMIRCSENYYGDLHHEYYLAHWEVKRNFPEPAFPPAATRSS